LFRNPKALLTILHGAWCKSALKEGGGLRGACVIAELSGLYHILSLSLARSLCRSLALAQISFPQHAHDVPLHTERKLIRSIHTSCGLSYGIDHLPLSSGLASHLALGGPSRACSLLMHMCCCLHKVVPAPNDHGGDAAARKI
jgi:hypothetical protein